MNAHDQGEERHAFDQRGRDDHGRLDVAGHFGLAGHALDGAGADLADAVAGADDDQARAERGAGQNDRRLPGDGAAAAAAASAAAVFGLAASAIAGQRRRSSNNTTNNTAILDNLFTGLISFAKNVDNSARRRPSL